MNTRIALATTGGLVFAFASEAAALPEAPVQGLSFIGEVTFATGFEVDGTEVGGLSGIDYDPYGNIFYALSDDRSATSPARFYTLGIDLSDGSLDAGDVAFQSVVVVEDPTGAPFPTNGVDPESIRFEPFGGTLYWTSEGDANALQKPFVREMTVRGEYLRDLRVPNLYNPTAAQTSGIRNNLAFESLTFDWRRQRVVVATENALFQDGSAASLTDGSMCRILEIDLRTARPRRQFFYVTEPIDAAPIPSGSFATNGLVELLAVAEDEYLAVERSFSVGVGNAIKIFRVNTAGATNIRGGVPAHPQPVAKELLLDLAQLGITLDNIEGITFGPRLPSGELSLILVSDNNFNGFQFTQFLAFAVER